MRRMSTVNATRVRGEAPGRGLGAAGSGRRATAWNPEVLPQGPLPSVSLPLPPGKAREPSACGPGNPCPLGPWTSTSSGRPRGGCSRAWSAAGRDRWARGPVPTSPRCAGTCSVVSPPRPPPLLFAYPATSCSPTRWAPCQRPAHAPFSPPPRPPPGPPQLPASPCAPCPAALALTPRPSGSSGCLSPSSGCAPGGADAPSPGGPQRPPFSVLPASPCTSGEAVAPAAASVQRPWWLWAQPPVPTGPLSRTGTGPGAMGCLMWCVWT